MKKSDGLLTGMLTALALFPGILRGDDGEVRLQVSGNDILLKVEGDKDDDWWMQTSTNFTAWTMLTNFGTLRSGNDANAPWRSAGTKSGPAAYYRARQTGGLYDPTLFRTVSIVYTQSSAVAFSNAMRLARQYETNIYLPRLWLDSGATNYHVGARFKGNTSYTLGGARKSINLEFDFITPDDDLMHMETVNLNNAAGDETVMREPLFFTVMSQYAAAPRGAMCQLFANGSLWSVYSLVQQENNQLIREWFPSSDGDRWRAPNAPAGSFESATSAFVAFFGLNAWYYTNHYILKNTQTNTLTALQRLTNAISILNLTPTAQLRDKAEDAWAVDSWLWFLALENIFVDDDSYWNKGADYGFYFEVESGRIHPVEHDGNESFTAAGSINYALSPVTGATGNNRPLLYKFLPINELRQRYLAHMRTVLKEYFNPAVMTPMINNFHRLSINAIIADPRKGITLTAYTNDLVALKTYVTNRYNFLSSHAELTPLQPNIIWVSGPSNTVYATNIPTITAQVTSNGGSGVSSVWLYFRDKPYGRFTARQMFDDGAHGDGPAGDNVYGAATTNCPAGNKIHFYIEARANNAAQAAIFSPERAEQVTYDYRVALLAGATTPVVVNEFMADNVSAYADPQGDHDDWIELRNLTAAPVNLTGLYLTDKSTNPRKWPFPAGTTVPANGYLIVWADENGSDTPALHANFKLSKDGEEILLVDTDANGNQVLDSITFGAQQTDVSYGRSAADQDAWTFMPPTPGAANQ